MPSDCAWSNAATARKALGPHEPDTLREPSLGRNYVVQPRNRVAAAMEMLLYTIILARLKACHASVPPMSSGFSLALSPCLIIICLGARILNKLNYTSYAEEIASPRKCYIRNLGFKLHITEAYSCNEYTQVCTSTNT